MNTYRIALISMSDFDRLPLGGEVRLLHNFLSQKKPQEFAFHLIGMSFSPEEPVGKWATRQIADISYPFFPICQVLKSKEKAMIPFRLRVVAGIKKYYQKIGLSDFDIIYVHTPEMILPLRGYEGKIALHIHSDILQTLRVSRFRALQPAFFSDLYTKTILRGILRADLLIWSADTIRQNFFSRYPKSESKIGAKSVVVHSSYDPALIPGPVSFSFRDDVIYFITVGRLAKGKRIDFLIEMFANFLKEMPAYRSELIVCGDGEEMEPLKDLATRKQIADRIHFTGNVDRPSLAAYLQHARGFLFASATETMSLVVLESLYMGVPVITSDVGDLHLAVRDGESGFCIRDFTGAQYIAAMKRLLSQPADEWSALQKDCSRLFSTAHE